MITFLPLALVALAEHDYHFQEHDDYDYDYYAVEVAASADMDLIGDYLGLEYLQQVGELDDFQLFRHAKTGDTSQVTKKFERLQFEPNRTPAPRTRPC